MLEPQPVSDLQIADELAGFGIIFRDASKVVASS
jgi:hypothetical protein